MQNNLEKTTKQIDRTGEEGISIGGQKMTIIRYADDHDLDVQLEDGEVAKRQYYVDFKYGYVYRNSPNSIGEYSRTNVSERITLIRYGSPTDVDVQFTDGTIVTNVWYAEFRHGTIENPKNRYKSSFYRGPRNPDRLGKTETIHCINLGQRNRDFEYKATIIRYEDENDMDIRFEDGAVIRNISDGYLRSGLLIHPKDERQGQIQMSKYGLKMKIVSYESSTEIEVVFEDASYIPVRGKSYYQFLQGNIIPYELKKKRKTRKAKRQIN